MRAVNLLPTERRTASGASSGLDPARRNLLLACGGVGVLLVAGLAFMVYSSSSSLTDKQSQLQTLQAQISSAATATSPPVAVGTRKATVVGIVANRLAWDQFLGTLSKVMPEDVWLQSLQSTVPGAAATLGTQQAAAAAASVPVTTTTSSSTTSTPPPAAPPPAASTFTISGYTYSQPSVARMMRRLDLVPWLSGVTLVSSSSTSIGSDTVFQFSVKAAVIAPETTP